MAGTMQLQLGLVSVRLAKPAQPGHDQAPPTMRVWLDVPSSRKYDISQALLTPVFQEFEVVADSKNPNISRLKPAGAKPNTTAQIDVSETYWCVWSFGNALQVPNKFDRVPGFGWPIQALLNDKKELILPNNRIMFLHEMSLAGIDLLGNQDFPQEFFDNRDFARKFYDELHIGLIFRVNAKPASVPDVFSGFHLKTNERFLHNAADINKNINTIPRVTLSLNQPPLRPINDHDKTVAVYCVKDFVGDSAEGETVCRTRLSPVPVASGLTAIPVDCSTMFVTLKPGANAVLAHEIGHALLAEPGMGKKWLDSRTPFSPADLATYRGRLETMLDGLKLGMPVANVIQTLDDNEHSAHASNLMFAIGQTGSSNQLTFLQVAIMRRAAELRFLNEP